MPTSKLLGAVALDRLLRTKRPVPVIELMDEDRRKVRATEDQEEVARQFERYNLVAAPVVDEDDRLVGVLTFDDIVDVIEQEAEEDIKALGGVGATKNCPTRSGHRQRRASPGCSSISADRAGRGVGDRAVRVVRSRRWSRSRC